MKSTTTDKYVRRVWVEEIRKGSGARPDLADKHIATLFLDEQVLRQTLIVRRVAGLVVNARIHNHLVVHRVKHNTRRER